MYMYRDSDSIVLGSQMSIYLWQLKTNLTITSYCIYLFPWKLFPCLSRIWSLLCKTNIFMRIYMALYILPPPQPLPLVSHLSAFSSAFFPLQQPWETCCSPNPLGMTSPHWECMHLNISSVEAGILCVSYLANSGLLVTENYSIRHNGSALMLANVRAQNKGAGKVFCQAALFNVLSGTLIIIKEQKQS